MALVACIITLPPPHPQNAAADSWYSWMAISPHQLEKSSQSLSSKHWSGQHCFLTSTHTLWQHSQSHSHALTIRNQQIIKVQYMGYMMCFSLQIIKSEIFYLNYC